MVNRPISITIIGWFKIVGGVIGLISMLATLNEPLVQEMMAKSPIPISIQYVMAFGGLAISVVCGIFFLQGQNWARYLYVIWSAVGILVGLVTSPFKIAMIPGVAFYLLIVFFLFRPNANAFFARAGANLDTQHI